MDYIRKEYSLSLAPLPSTKTRRDTPKKKSNATPAEPRWTLPEQRIKNQIEHPLEMTGLIARGKPMKQLVNEIYESIFRKEIAKSLQQVLIDLNERKVMIDTLTL